jgi:hypothetical protein
VKLGGGAGGVYRGVAASGAEYMCSVEQRLWTVLCRQPARANGTVVVRLSRIRLGRTPVVGGGLLGRIVTEVHTHVDPPTVIVEQSRRSLGATSTRL